MKKPSLILLFLLFAKIISAQSPVDSLVDRGIQYHDAGNYDSAIVFYEQALKIAPNSALAHAELSMTYMYKKDYEKALEHSNAVLDQKDLDDNLLVSTYITKGSCLDYLGSTKESIKLFKKGIKKFGDHYLLHYNLGYNYYHLEEYDKARESFIAAVDANPGHSTSHLMLGYISSDENLDVQSILSLHYFLFLEPHTERSKTAYELLMEQFGGNVVQKEGDPSEITIYMDSDNSANEFHAAKLMLSMLEATRYIEENEDKSNEELFLENTQSFFQMLGELKEKKNNGLWWDFYVPFFYDLANSEHLKTYCNYISQYSNEKAAEWVDLNGEKLEAFDEWLSEK